MKTMTTALTVAVALAVGSAPAFAQAKPKGKQPAKQPAATTKAPAASAPANPPQISAVGLRIVGLGLGASGSELKPFNESPGTTVALAIVAPKGIGIVDIDDHGSKLDAFTDDKGQSLLEEGRIGPFPHITEDGSAALAEVEVRARPSAGATSVSVQGTITMTLAGGTKPFKAANVKLDANQTFKIGTTTLTISDPKVQEDRTEFTVNLPRALLTSIREIHFYNAKNEPIEATRRGSGYFNEKAELELAAKTTDKAITIEFEIWQNLKTAKYPFNVQAGLGIAAGGASGGTSDGSAAGGGDKPGPAPKAEAKKPEGPPPTVSASEGADSVDAVVKQMQTAAAAGKGAQVLSVIYPTERGDYAQGVAMALAFLPMASMDDQKAAEAMTKELDAFFDKHKIKPPFNKEPDELFKGVDMNAFVSDAFAFIKTHTKKGEKPMLPVPDGKVEDVKITGDAATATLNGKDQNFSKISGRWFIRLK